MNEHLQQFIGVCFDGLTNLNKFHDVDTPFAAFVFGDERLRPRQAFDDGVAALEASLSPAGKVVAFLAMTGDGHPITDRETEHEIGALRAKGAPANARIVPITWLPSIDPL